MFKFEQQWIVSRSTKNGSIQYGFNRIDSDMRWHTLDNNPVEVVPVSEWTPDLWASLAYAALCSEGVCNAACLPYRLMDTFREVCGGKEFGDRMPMYIFLMRSIVACRQEVEPDAAVSRQEAQKALENYNAV